MPCTRLTIRALQYHRGRRRDIICAYNAIGAGRAVGEVTGLPSVAERLPAPCLFLAVAELLSSIGTPRQLSPRGPALAIVASTVVERR